MKVLFTPTAEKHFLSALEFIQIDSQSAAVSFRDRALSVLKRLQGFPDSGRRIPEFPNLPHREVIVPPYRFFYCVKEEAVWIVDVWHDAQIPKKPTD